MRGTLLVFSALLLTSCYLSDRSVKGFLGQSATSTLSVTPEYPSFTKWNQHLDAADTTQLCDTSSWSSDSFYGVHCIHAGERRVVNVSGFVDCDELTIESSPVDAFVWRCEDSGGAAEFHILGLKPGFGLRNLIDSDGWIPLQVEVRHSGTLVGESVASVWWTNTIYAPPENDGVADSLISLDNTDDDGAGPDQAFGDYAIFALESSAATQGYYLGRDGYSFVTLPGAELSYAGLNSDNCGSSKALLCAEYPTQGLWLEGEYVGDSLTATLPDSGLLMDGPYYMNYRNIRAQGFAESGIDNRFVVFAQFVDVITTNNGGSGLYCYGCGWIDYNRIESHYNGSFGIRVYDHSGGEGRMHDVRVTNNASSGIFFGDTSWGTFNKILAYGNGAEGVRGDSFFEYTLDDSSLLFVTALNNASHGVTFNSSYDSLLGQILSVNNGGAGISISGTEDSYFQQLAVAHNGTYGLRSLNSDNGTYSGLLIAGQNTTADCNESGGVSAGIDSSCVSTATYDAGADLSSSFVGAVTSDSTNTAHVNGLAALASLFDWFNFDNSQRIWGTELVGDLTDVGLRGVCSSPSGDCAIWDSTLKTADATILNRSVAGSAAVNAALVDGAACPAWLSGNTVTALPDIATARRIYLTHAIEYVGDYIGNEDGLCESNETCVAAPNIGYYQGHGDLFSVECDFQDGTVTGVTMHAYPNNGSL